MSIFKKAKSYASDQVRSSLSGARERGLSELNAAKNRLSGFLGLGDSKGKFTSGKSEPLFYPLQNVTDDPTGDRTSFWLQIEVKTYVDSDTGREYGNKSERFLSGALGGDLGALQDKFRASNEGIVTRTIWLYLPSMTQTDAISYADTNIGVAGAVAAAAVAKGNIGNILDAAGQQVDQLASTVSSIRSGATPSVGAIATAVGFAKDIPVINKGANAVSYASGITKNPHTISLFQGVNLRTHAFEFDFVPRNAAEARQVQQIVKFFRLAMYPESLTGKEAFGDSLNDPDLFEDTDSEGNTVTRAGTAEELGADVSLAFIHPNTFNLTAMRMRKDGEMVSMNDQGLIYGECVLTGCTVDFDPSGSMSQRPDGSFPNTKMTLQFSETETLDRAKLRSLYK